MISWLSMPFTGSVETEGAAHWRLAKAIRPDLRIVTIRRERKEVIQSLLSVPLMGLGEWSADKVGRMLERTERKLDQIERRVPDVTRVAFASLATEEGARTLWSGAFGASPFAPPFDPEWFRVLNTLEIEASLSH